ncbi:hypothetical protein BSKO_01984 [Bryopsis sp. KO-2023]|nr:hypothetical protein BSKO_01984 [Bryopsis sp. KO-2023]
MTTTIVNRGVVGYTGAMPNSSSLLIDTKGSTRRQCTGNLADQNTKASLNLSKNDTHISSEYNRRYGAHTSYKPVTKEGGGYWISQRQLQESKPFCGISTYKAEIQMGGESEKEKYKLTADVKSTLSQSEGILRARCSQKASQRKPAVEWNGEALGYQTEYTMMTLKEPITKLAPRTRPSGGADSTKETDVRHKVLPSAMLPALDGKTMYHQNYGQCGSDPLARTAANEEEMTRTASTRELSTGTTRNTHHIPGYAGFLPEAPFNEVALDQGEGLETRTEAKVDMLLYNNDQYSRSRVPGYTGFKPQENRNITVVQPSSGPPKQTTQGIANMTATSSLPGVRDTSNFLSSRKGMMGFFTGGGQFVSDNGESEAQKFYQSLKPLEGLPKIELASKATLYGARFSQ